VTQVCEEGAEAVRGVDDADAQHAIFEDDRKRVRLAGALHSQRHEAKGVVCIQVDARCLACLQFTKQPVLWRIFLALVSLERTALTESPASVSSGGILEERCTKAVETRTIGFGAQEVARVRSVIGRVRGGDAHLEVN
jgi:hypothetical protein